MARKVIYSLFIVLIASFSSLAQVTTSPAFPTADQPITITYDAKLGTSGLVGASRVFMHSGVILSGPTGTGWQYVVGTWGDPTSPGEMTSKGNDVWEITINPYTYFGAAGLPNGTTVYRIGMVFREAGPCGGAQGVSTACKEGKDANNQDIFVEINTTGYAMSVTSPTGSPQFMDPGASLSIDFTASEISEMMVREGLTTLSSASGVTSLQYTYTAGASGATKLILECTYSGETLRDTIEIIVRTPTVQQARPTGIIDGINYDAGDPTKATLCLWAPLKTDVYVTGDFNNWDIDPAFQMKKDGERFWIEITGLTPATEYGFQYLVDETIWVADPYAEKILDPDDQYIPQTTYPNLKTYPQKALRGGWNNNRIAVFQTGQTPYNWNVQNFVKPANQDLVIYELLIRDFFAVGAQHYTNLIDTLSYLKDLGINAVELMPVMEFNGNDSWGYNPTFMFAPDKFYGTKDGLKAFIDAAHAQGIAVLFDIAVNHQDLPGTYAQMYFENGKPAANSPWFNVNATHPYNVFNDFNHESTYTQKYIDTVAHYWINEYKVDGFRYDLSKGFTQVNYGSNVGAWSSRDASRIALLKRMYDQIRTYDKNAILILEHFADNSEEIELANYGFLLWGNANHAFSQSTMGYADGSEIAWSYYGSRGWSAPNLISYMESHDEERIMFKNLQYGNSNSAYTVKNVNNGLQRIKAASALFYLTPGPKMLWQFGEFGYDVSIDFNGRLGIKPTKWEYLDEDIYLSTYSFTRAMIHFKNTYPISRTKSVQFDETNGLEKQLILRGTPYIDTPANSDEMNCVVVANFQLTKITMPIKFPHLGTWYNYVSGKSIEVTSIPFDYDLKAGEFNIWTDVQLTPPDIILNTEEKISDRANIYPNPARDVIFIQLSGMDVQEGFLLNSHGQILQQKKAKENKVEFNTSGLPNGLYFVRLKGKNFHQMEKIIIVH